MKAVTPTRRAAASRARWSVRILAATSLGCSVAIGASAPRSIFEDVSEANRAIYESRSVRLWEGRAPSARGDAGADIPRLYPVLRPQASTPVAAVLVFPGGGYTYHAAHEAFPIAERLRAAGVAAFVLKYRLQPYDSAVSLLDAQRAVRYLRAHSCDFGIDPARIGAIGFSAGGQLAAAVSAQADDGCRDAPDPVDRESCRLQTALLIYPALVSRDFSPANTAHRPLGDLASLDGLHRTVDATTPPTFLLVGYDDVHTPYENCLAYAAALHAAGVRFELHILGTGSHGFGLRSPDPRVQIWSQLAINWLATANFLPVPSASVATR
jgi:acetyl esterase/lipase